MQNVVKFTLFILVASLYAGCTPKYYNPAYAVHEMQSHYDKDSLECTILARNLVQMPHGQMIIAQQPPQMTYGNFSGSDSRGNFYSGSYTEYQAPNMNAGLQEQMALYHNSQIIFQQSEARNLRLRVFTRCMAERGWRRE